MKIRVRLSLLFVLCSTTSLLVCGFLLLRASAKGMIRSVEDNAVSELGMLKTSFASAASKTLDAGASDSLRRSVLVYVFQSYADDTFSGSQYVLKRGGETFYNNSGYAPDVLLDGLEQNTVTWQGEKLFAAVTETDLNRETYQIYLIRNVTDLYDSIDRLRLQFYVICAAAVLLSAALILWATARTLRPLKTLEKEAAAMARGEYHARIPLPKRSSKPGDEIAAVSESFNRMAAAVEQHIDAVTAVAEERKMLIGALTHEMKTPMTAIIGYADLLERAKLSKAQSEEALAFIHREAQRLERLGCYTLGDVARLSRTNEDALYHTFGVNAELLIDHAWGWEPAEMAAIKAFKPQSNSISSGQVLTEPYDWEKARIVAREMTEALVLELVRKKVVTRQVVLTVCYDRTAIRSRTPGEAGEAPWIVVKTGKPYTGTVEADRYGRPCPKPAHGTGNLDRWTASSGRIVRSMMELYDRIIDRDLTVRRLYVVACGLIPEDEIPEEDPVQLDLFTDWAEEEKRKEAESAADAKERKLQLAALAIHGKFGKNALLKGMSFQEGATARRRNEQIGGHRAGSADPQEGGGDSG